MKTKSYKLKVSAAIGTVSAEYFIPENAHSVMTLAHGAGAGMDHSFMVSLATLLAEKGITTLRFNFPFKENLKGRPDSPAVAHETIAAALDHAQKTFPTLPLFASGKSFGGRMTSQYLSANPRPEVKGIVFYGFPLHPAGKPGIDRAEHLNAIKIPMLFLQGTKDTLATWELIESVCKKLKTAKLVKIEGADHAFKAGKKEIIPLLATETQEWVAAL